MFYMRQLNDMSKSYSKIKKSKKGNNLKPISQMERFEPEDIRDCNLSPEVAYIIQDNFLETMNPTLAKSLQAF
jgi:hypothetical protein